MRKWHLWMVIASAAAIATFAVPRALARLAYLRPAVAAGEIHRLLSAHLVHASARHLVLDLAALAVAFTLVGRELDALRWAKLVLATALSSSLAVHWLSPSTAAFAGLSALVHAVLGGGAAVLLCRRSAGGLWLATGLTVKLALERLNGTPLLPLAVPAAVAIDAHLYGLLAGAAVGTCLARRAAATSAAASSSPSATGPTPASSTPSSASAPARPASEL